MVYVQHNFPYYVTHRKRNERGLAVKFSTNVASQKIQTTLHQWPAAFTLGPIFYVASSCWGLLDSSHFVLPQCPALESSLPPRILPRFRAPTGHSRCIWRCRCPYYLVVVVGAGYKCLPPLLTMVGGVGTWDF